MKQQSAAAAWLVRKEAAPPQPFRNQLNASFKFLYRDSENPRSFVRDVPCGLLAQLVRVGKPLRPD